MNTAITFIAHWFKGIRLKLLALAFIPILGLIFVSTVSFISITILKDELLKLSRINIPKKTLSADINLKISLILESLQKSYIQNKNKTIKDAAIQDARSFLEQARTSHMKLLELKSDTKLENLLSQFNSGLDEFEGLVVSVLDQLEAGSDSNLAKAISIISSPEMEKSRKVLQTTIYEINQIVDADATSNSDLALNSSQHSQQIIFATGVFLLLCSALMVFLTSSKLVQTLTDILKSLKQSAQNTQSTSQIVSQSAETVSNQSTESAAAIEESAASLEETLAMTRRNSESAKKANEIAEKSLSEVNSGNSEIRLLITHIQSLLENSKKVAGITDVIDDLAFQTNLLALNASVEAARAGEQGRGFAIVAEAVRGLANRSSQSAKEISNLISESSSLVEKVKLNADESGNILNLILNLSKDVKDIVQEITFSSSEQEISLQQISTSIAILDQAAQNNAASSEQLSESSQEMLNESNSLYSYVSSFEKIISGK